MILIDTQVLVWSSFGDRRLGQSSRDRMLDASVAGHLVMSPISAWEIAMLVDKRRLLLDMSVQDWIARTVEDHHVRWIDLLPTTAAAAGQLPGKIHRDPADRLIIATARALGCPLLTADRQILDYAKAGHLEAIDARR